MEEKFEYAEAVARLEQIASKVEDPSTGLGDIDRYVSESNVLIEKCRAYLRTVRSEIEKADR